VRPLPIGLQAHDNLTGTLNADGAWAVLFRVLTGHPASSWQPAWRRLRSRALVRCRGEQPSRQDAVWVTVKDCWEQTSRPPRWSRDSSWRS